MKYVVRVATNCGIYVYTTKAKNDNEALNKVAISFSIEHRDVTINSIYITVKESLAA